MIPVPRSLTVLLPVHNAQSTLGEMVMEALEVAPELTDQLELVIVDDGSTDATCELAGELSHRYPQVRFFRHGQHLGHEAAVQTGLKLSTGQVVLLRDGTSGETIDEISKRLRDTPDHRWDQYHPQALAGDLGSSGGRPGYRILPRRTLESFHGPAQPARPNFLSRLKDFALGE
jgi:hypothetical protein